MSKYLTVGGEFASKKLINKNEILDLYPYGTWTLTGRNALDLILKSQKISKKYIYLPIFNCPSIYQVVKKYFNRIFFYDLDKNFKPKIANIKKNSIILLVNYFGLTNNIKFKNDIVIIRDLTHSAIQKNRFKKNEFYFLSLRKHGICNFGGWANVILDNQKKNKK